jgi:hypothetical protein
MATKNAACPEFTRTRDYIKRYVILDDNALDVVTAWTMHTWLFSPACDTPPTTPYLYIAAEKGAGKTLLGQDVLGTIVRSPMAVVGITGPSLIRLVSGSDDSENDDENPVSTSPTLTIDEVDALYSGAKDEVLRMMLNAGYRRGGTVPRVSGTRVINYSAFCPKILMGIDNGHLPDTVLDRSIRIDLVKASQAEMSTIEPFYHYEIEDEAAELSEELSRWAKNHSEQIRAYKPPPIDGLQPRQWEIARTLVQVAYAIGNESRIREAVHHLLTANPAPVSAAIKLYSAIRDMLAGDSLDGILGPVDRLTTNQILEGLAARGISVPGNSGKGLAVAMAKDGVKGGAIRFADRVSRGYYANAFDEAFARYLDD